MLNILITILIISAILLLGGLAVLSENDKTEPKISYIPIEESSSSSSEGSSETDAESSLNPTVPRKPEKTQNSASEDLPVSEENISQEIVKININQATVEDLVKIDGVSEKMAETILAYRELAGGFTDISDLLKIKGMSLNREEIDRYFSCE